MPSPKVTTFFRMHKSLESNLGHCVRTASIPSHCPRPFLFFFFFCLTRAPPATGGVPAGAPPTILSGIVFCDRRTRLTSGNTSLALSSNELIDSSLIVVSALSRESKGVASSVGVVGADSAVWSRGRGDLGAPGVEGAAVHAKDSGGDAGAPLHGSLATLIEPLAAMRESANIFFCG